MLRAVGRRTQHERKQIWLLIATRSCSACAMAMLAAGAANDLFLRLNGGDFARTQRLLSAVATINTVADFVVAPVVGGSIDAFGRKGALLFGQAIDALMRLLVAVRPSVVTFVLYRVSHEMARRMIVPARSAMFGDYVGRGSTDYILLQQLQGQVSTVARTVALQLGSRLIRDGNFRANFAAAAAFNCIGLCATLLLKEYKSPPSAIQANHARRGIPPAYISNAARA